MGGLFHLFWGKSGDFQDLGHAHSLVFWQCLGTVMTPLGVSFHLLIEHQGLVLSAILVPFDSNWFMLCPWAISFFQKFAPCPFPSCYTRTGLTSLLLIRQEPAPFSPGGYLCLASVSNKQTVTGGKGAGHNFGKNDIAQGHSIIPLESNGTKMADKTRPWSSISKWNDTPRGAMTVLKHS